MANERNERQQLDAGLRNPLPFVDELWGDKQTAALYGGVKAGSDNSWQKYISGDKVATNLELVEGTPREIKFETNVFSAFEKAMKQGKPLIVEFSQEDCGHCDRLDRETFKSDEVKTLADKAIWVRVDVNKDDEKGNISQLVSDLRIDRAPTVVVLDAKQESLREMGRMVGFFAGKQFSDNLKQILPKDKQTDTVADITPKQGERKTAA